MGAQALCFAWAKKPSIVAEEFDYGREHGFAWTSMFGGEKPVFNSNDYGSISFQSARTQIADA